MNKILNYLALIIFFSFSCDNNISDKDLVSTKEDLGKQNSRAIVRPI